MPIIPLGHPGDARIAEYRNVPDGVLLREKGLFVAEGRLVVRQLLTASRLQPQSLLVTEAALATLSDLLRAMPDLPAYVAPQVVLNDIVGFNFHRGCLAIGARPRQMTVLELVNGPPAEPSEEEGQPPGSAMSSSTMPGTARPREFAPGRRCAELKPGATKRHAFAVSRAVVLERVSNVDNVGGIFRSVAALGGHAVILGPGCGDPLYRKAIRTSMGATLRVPFALAEHWPGALGELTEAGFTLVALTPSAGADLLEDVAADIQARPRVALILGAEGEGLSPAALDSAHLRVRIPMASGTDSINVTMAAAIALYRIV
jgi:tRNA G18 (ribose-2'-O)-methylase SpoU